MSLSTEPQQEKKKLETGENSALTVAARRDDAILLEAQPAQRVLVDGFGLQSPR
jgi:hypothetical protein